MWMMSEAERRVGIKNPPPLCDLRDDAVVCLLDVSGMLEEEVRVGKWDEEQRQRQHEEQDREGGKGGGFTLSRPPAVKALTM